MLCDWQKQCVRVQATRERFRKKGGMENDGCFQSRFERGDERKKFKR